MIKASVVATFTENLLGSAPRNKEVFTKFLKDRQQDRADALSALESENEVATLPPEVDESQGYTGFHSDEGGLFIYDYVVKGFFKEAGNILKDTLKIKALRSKMDNLLFIFPRRIYLLDSTEKPLLKPHGVNERPLRAQTMQGPRVTLAKSDYVNAGSVIKFDLQFLDGADIKHPEQIVETCLGYGALKGLGQWRNGSWGRFSYKLTFTQVAPVVDKSKEEPKA
jgi:hypothetical protein